MDYTRKMMELLHEFVSCQNVGPPYRGWNLVKLRDVRNEASRLPPDKTEVSAILTDLMASYNLGGGGGVSMGHLNKVAARARTYLKLPSVDDLNPDIKQMKDIAVRNFGGVGHPSLPRQFRGMDAVLEARAREVITQKSTVQLMKFLRSLTIEERNAIIDSPIWEDK